MVRKIKMANNVFGPKWVMQGNYKSLTTEVDPRIARPYETENGDPGWN
jgi:hypothetical protein